MDIRRVLIIEEDDAVRQLVLSELLPRGIQVLFANTFRKALDLLRDASIDLVFSASNLPGLPGLELLKFTREHLPEVAVVLVADHPTVDAAVEAVKHGAVDYLAKPLTPSRLHSLVDRVSLEKGGAINNRPGGSRPAVIAESSAMKCAIEMALRAARTDATVLVTGESGTGKEVIASLIHQQSKRRERPYVRVNCAAIPDSLIESEFFGHERGAFTGAHMRKPGRFELAHAGTLLLDEVTEIPPWVQPKLLRAIQEQEFERVGGVQSVKVDVRLIATSNRNIGAAVESQAFREDLYYRLNVIPIHLPPLRERPEDILPLALYFLNQACQRTKTAAKELSKAAADFLLSHSWPGNIRELANAMERAAILTDSTAIEPSALQLTERSSR